MDLPRYVYAIYPFDENGNYAGVYVGSTSKLKRRLKIHFFDKSKDKGKQTLLHSLMRENGYSYQILEIVSKYEDAHLEYDWIEFFKTNSSLTVFNAHEGKHPDCINLGKTIGAVGKPIFANGGVVWQLHDSNGEMMQ